jgi:transcriptional regulator with XRE-family HTH domain
MVSPTEHDFIEKCKHLIECRLEWKSSAEWKNRDYEYLSELITSKTKIIISVSTLKRIWQNNRSRIPHLSTLNALAAFLDYENWNVFKTKLKEELIPANTEEFIPRHPNKSKWLWPSILIVVLSSFVLVLIILFISKPRHKEPIQISDNRIAFNSKKTVSSGLPNSVVFYYELSKVEFDSAFIQQDWDKRKRTRISKQNNFHTCIYYYPGYYTAKLVVNDQIVKEHPLFITTDGWIAVYKKTYEQEIPVYLKNIEVVSGNRLFVSTDDLRKNKIENDKDFIIGFYNAQDYGNVVCDTFRFETIIKNDPKEGGLTCQYAAITVEAQEGVMTTVFSEKGCTSNVFLMFGDTYIGGTKNDLSSFGTDLSQWHKITYKVVNKNVTILLDDKEIHHLKFNREIGKIINLAYHFYGCGSVSSVKLWDKNNRLVFEDHFSR